MKSKISLLYARLFATVVNLTDNSNNKNNIDNRMQQLDWHELFLLKPHGQELWEILDKIPQSNLYQFQNLFFSILCRCFEYMQADKSPYMRQYAAQTANLILSYVFSLKWHNFTFDVLNTVCGLERADLLFSALTKSLEELKIRPVYYSSEKNQIEHDALSAGIDLLWTIVTASESVNINGLLSFLTTKSLFFKLLSITLHADSPAIRERTLLIICVLVTYKNPENAFAVELASLKQVEDDSNGIYEALFSLLHGDDVAWMASCTSKAAKSTQTSSSLLGYVYSLLTPPAYSTEMELRELSPERLMILHTLLLYCEKFRRFWLTNYGIECIIPHFLVIFCNNGEQSQLRTCLHILWIMCLLSNSNGMKSVEICRKFDLDFYQLILPSLKHSQSQLYRHIISTEFDCREPILGMSLIFIALNERKTNASLIQVALNIVLHHLKQAKIQSKRVEFKWDFLYRTVISVAKLFAKTNSGNSSSDSIAQPESERITETVRYTALTILDYTLCFGDHFLPDTQSYDALFYNLILNHEFFMEQYHKQQYVNVEMRNIQKVIEGFMTKYVRGQEDGSTVLDSSEQVLECIRKYYDCVELDLNLAENNASSMSPPSSPTSPITSETMDTATFELLRRRQPSKKYY